MRLTPLHGHPPCSTVCGRPPRKKERRATAGRALAGAEHGSALQGQCRTKQKDAANAASFLFSISSSVTQCSSTVTGNCRGGAVWVGRTVGATGPRHASGGWAGRPTRSCRVRRTAHTSKAPSSPRVRALCAKHCFASARTHSRQRLGRTAEGFTACPANPHRPTQQAATQSRFGFGFGFGFGFQPLTLPAAGGPRVSAAPPVNPIGRSRRCRRCRNSRSDSSPGTAGGSPRRSSTPVPGTRSRW